MTELHDRGFLFLISSVQMAPPPGERAHLELQWSFLESSFPHLSSSFSCFQREKRAGEGVFRLCLSSQSPEMWSEPVSTAATATWRFMEKLQCAGLDERVDVTRGRLKGCST